MPIQDTIARGETAALEAFETLQAFPDVPEIDFRNAMASFASGVTLVTTRDADGEPHGFTASSFASLSLHPPMVLVCMGKRVTTYDVFTRASTFAVSILNADQAHLAKLFATRGADRFGDPAMIDSAGGLPVALGALAQLDCALEILHPGGDHAILIGRPLSIRLAPGKPLVHWDRGLGGYAEG
jgi:flavin reductase ActVB